jgi:hypothetical protein
MCEWLKQAVLKTAVRETVPGVRIPLPPPRSLNCREIPPHLTPKYAEHAHCSRSLPAKWTAEKRTLDSEGGHWSRLFSGGHIRSPVSKRASGECNAITSRGFCHSLLTFVRTLEAALGASRKDVYRDQSADVGSIARDPDTSREALGSFPLAFAHFVSTRAASTWSGAQPQDPFGSSTLHWGNS